MSGHTKGPWKLETVKTSSGFCHKIGPFPWKVGRDNHACIYVDYPNGAVGPVELELKANAHLMAAAPKMLEALHEGRRALGDHFAPNDCYATGPLTGDPIRDLVQCPACSFIAMYDDAISLATPSDLADEVGI